MSTREPAYEEPALQISPKTLLTFAFAFLFPTGLARGADSTRAVSLGIDFTRSVSFEGPTDPLGDFTNFRLAVDSRQSRIELEGGYYFRARDREAGAGTNAEKRETRTHFVRTGMGIYYHRGGEASFYAGPKVIYQKILSKTRQGASSYSQDLDLIGAGPTLGLERKLVEGLSLAGEIQALYVYGLLEENGLGNYDESNHLLSTTAAVVFRWKL